MAFDPSNVDVEHFLESLEIRNITEATEEEFRFSCPYPSHIGGDEKPSAYMNKETTAFFCHGCKEKGNAVSFAAYVLSVSLIEASRLLRQKYQPGGINPDERDVRLEVEKIFKPKEVVKQPIIPKEIFEKMQVSWDEAYYHWENGNGHPATDYLFDRGFSPHALDDWEVVYDEISDRVAVTVRDLDGNVVGFKARAWGDHQKPKYLVLGDRPLKPVRYGFPCYQTGSVVFGAHRIPKNSHVILCEGELNVIALSGKLGKHAVAINGSHFTEQHAKIIRRVATEVTCFLDTDDAGQRAVWGWEDANGKYHSGIMSELSPFMPVNLVPDHDGDAASMNENEIEALLENSSPALENVLRSRIRGG